MRAGGGCGGCGSRSARAHAAGAAARAVAARAAAGGAALERDGLDARARGAGVRRVAAHAAPAVRAVGRQFSRIPHARPADARAHALLRDPASRHLGTAEIGFAAGFGEVSTFYRRFKQRYGVAPGEFRAG
ncbi:helix-turn-helix domain-containing protein [Hydrogenophaga sp. UC242_50]|uniref:helix-turn-helix domain-containing protein n=1 Tax=Hydrogenophaga sp. UC242_50 TaxID=3350169 RepID=UPI0036D39D3F